MGFPGRVPCVQAAFLHEALVLRRGGLLLFLGTCFLMRIS